MMQADPQDPHAAAIQEVLQDCLQDSMISGQLPQVQLPQVSLLAC